jgi:O-antigen/teichoic acid export membrane protein
MFGFGSRLLASGLLDTIFQNIYLVVIGKLFSPAALGVYTQADKIQQLPTANFAGIISRVAFPVFSSIQADAVRLKAGMRKALKTLAFVNFPMMIGLAVTAKPLITVLLTEKWAPCVVYLQLLCVVGLFYPLHVINLNVLQAIGRSDLFFRLEILKKGLIVASIALTYRWGIIAMIYGQIAVSLAGYYLNSYYTGKFIKYYTSQQMLDAAPSMAIAIVMGISLFFIQFLPLNGSILLITQILIGILIYTGLSCLLKVSAFVESLRILKDVVSPRRTLEGAPEIR